jgi:hypothetical protein
LTHTFPIHLQANQTEIEIETVTIIAELQIDILQVELNETQTAVTLKGASSQIKLRSATIKLNI